MSRPTVFIHTNDQQMVGAKIARHALLRNSPSADAFDVRILNLEDYPQLTRRQNQTYRRKGAVVKWQNRDLQSFSPLRFLPPQEMGYEGRALVIDPDVFALGDVHELLTSDMGGKAILCRRIVPPDGRPPFFNTSVMLMDCERLRHWNWEQRLDAMFGHELDYGDWIFLRTEDQDTIGELAPEWNHFDTLNEHTKMLHNTEKSTQPWKAGLPADFNLNYAAAGMELKWGVIPRPVINRVKRLLGRPCDAAPKNYSHYLPHPDERQTELFFKLLAECVESGEIELDFLRHAIEHQYIRADVLEQLDQRGARVAA